VQPSEKYNFNEVHEKYLEKGTNPDYDLPIQIKRSCFKMTFIPGSDDMIKFLEIIYYSKSPVFIQSELRFLIDFKFYDMFYYIIAFNMTNVLLAFGTYGFQIFVPINNATLIFFLVFVFCFTVLEIIQAYHSKSSYLLDGKNYIDILALGSGLLWGILMLK
jgi:hypothetical protein